MTHWQTIQADPANSSIYGVTARRLLPEELTEPMKEIARLSADAGSAVAGGVDDESRERHSREVIAAVQTVVESTQGSGAPALDDVLDVAIALEYLDFVEGSGAALSEGDSASISSAREQLQKCAEDWVQNGALSEAPGAHARKLAGSLTEAVQVMERVANKRLFINLEKQEAVLVDRKELGAAVGPLKARESELLDLWGKVVEDLNRLGLTGDPGNDEAVKARLKEESGAAGGDGKAVQNLKKLEDLEARQQDLASRACQLLEEEAFLKSDAQRREEKLEDQSFISQFDVRRESILPDFDPANINVEDVKQARAILSGHLVSLEGRLREVIETLPPECLTPSGDGVNLRFVCLNRIWKLNRRQEFLPMILREDVFGFIFKQGEFYQDVIAGMERTIKFMETLAAEHAHQVQTLQDLVEVIKQGGVLQAEKRLSKLERKFRGVSYRRCDEAIQEAVRPLRDAKRAESEVEEYLKKRQGLMGKLFKDKDTLRKLETSISAVRSQAGALPKGELRDVVTGLCQKMEASLK